MAINYMIVRDDDKLTMLDTGYLNKEAARDWAIEYADENCEDVTLLVLETRVVYTIERKAVATPAQKGE